MGGANGSNANQFLAIQPSQIVAATQYYGIDGWDFDIENTAIPPNAFYQIMLAIRTALNDAGLTNVTMNLCIETTQTLSTSQSQ